MYQPLPVNQQMVQRLCSGTINIGITHNQCLNRYRVTWKKQPILYVSNNRIGDCIVYCFTSSRSQVLLWLILLGCVVVRLRPLRSVFLPYAGDLINLGSAF